MALARRSLVLSVALCSVLVVLLLGFYRYPDQTLRPFSSVYGSFGAGDSDHVYDVHTQGKTPSSDDIAPGVFPKIHPIDTLIDQANTDFSKLVAKETHDVAAAAAAYRKRRGRHPPPRFDQWVKYAQSKGSLIIEDFFDQIHIDLEPFWGLPAYHIRVQAPTWPHVITVRDGEARSRDDAPWTAEWLPLWLEAMQEIAPFLPDVDMAFNDEDEPRLLVPWETIDGYMGIAMKTKHIRAPANKGSTIITDFSSLENLSEKGPPAKPKPWLYTDPYWYLAREACHPDSAARRAKLDSNFTTPPEFPTSYPKDSFYGFVSNWTTAKSVCDHEHLRNLHGSIIGMPGASVTNVLFPIFGGCKVQGINNDILVPPAMYLTKDVKFDAGDQHTAWRERKDRFVWRGQASGGDHRSGNWARFHRHRFIAMVNSTTVKDTEIMMTKDPLHPHDPEPDKGLAYNFYLPDKTLYPIAALNHSSPMGAKTVTTPMGDWIAPMSNAGFTHMMCYPQDMSVFTPGKTCEYTDPYFHQTDRIPMQEQMGYKILPDIDGQTYSGRYRTFLKSGSLPIKATIFAEWHDSRLVPWHHFAPMHNEFMEWWSLLEYFLGYRGPSTRTAAAEKAAAAAARKTVDGGELRSKDERAADPQRVASRPASGAEEKHPSKKLPYVKNHDSWEVKGHDDVMRVIAEDGRDWADRVLRREDMLVYMYRLILEYARICDDRRVDMGYVADLTGSP